MLCVIMLVCSPSTSALKCYSGSDDNYRELWLNCGSGSCSKAITTINGQSTDFIADHTETAKVDMQQFSSHRDWHLEDVSHSQSHVAVNTGLELGLPFSLSCPFFVHCKEFPSRVNVNSKFYSAYF